MGGGGDQRGPAGDPPPECGYINKAKTRPNEVNFIVTKFGDITKNIIPFFSKTSNQASPPPPPIHSIAKAMKWIGVLLKEVVKALDFDPPTLIGLIFLIKKMSPIGVGGSDWCKVAELMKNKQHLTAEGLKQIKKIKAGMNRGIKSD